MRIRTQLILATFLLAVVPLAAIVTYSYRSSRHALETAERRETERMTQQMDSRLASIRTDLDERINLVSALPVADAATGDVDSSIAAAMGDAANIVESLEFKPLVPVPPPQPQAKPQPAAKAETQPESGKKVIIVREGGEPRVVAEADAKTAVGAVGKVPMSPGMPTAPVLIDLPNAPMMPQYAISEKQRELLEEIGELGGQLGNHNLTPDEREDLRKELAASQRKLHDVIVADSRQYREQLRRARRGAGVNVAPMPAPAAVPAPAAPAAVEEVAKAAEPVATVAPKVVRGMSAAEVERVRIAEKKAALILGRRFKAPVRQEGEVVGQITPAINFDRVIRRVLGAAQDRDEIPFAIDREGTVYTRTPEHRQLLDSAGIVKRVRSNESLRGIPGWIVSSTTDKTSGLRIGVARPVGETMEELKRTAARNFGIGLGLIAFALIGVVPLSNHLTRDVRLVTEGAERIAQGDLMTRLPVKTNNELGQLARAFNQMAEDLSLQQQMIVEQEVQQRMMSVEYQRKSVELEDARRFQLSMLPKEVPQHEQYDIAVYTRTATEVGGDYYDFHVDDDGTLSITIGDATGHGAKAGTMVTVIKTLFAGYESTISPSVFLGDAAEKIKRMELGRMSMALSLGRLEDRRLTLASAGMPPVLIHRAASSTVEEVALEATPLGTLGTAYPEKNINLSSGDTVLFLTDGFPELMNNSSQQLGYVAAIDTFAAAAAGAATAKEVIASLERAVRRWHGDAPPNDDVTFVVARVS
ncbi:MAG TPA: SpoIIE family protein phosphatase [Thermoanaerobaculia bacterium]|nr:SpoIIE family protein phosphatase [Thermoanaerobaculia bacterium]